MRNQTHVFHSSSNIFLHSAWIACAAIITAFIPEAHTLFCSTSNSVLGKPAYIAACLAGACPVPA
jgi:hypothetical protein